ncbi:MAG: D-aminoacyl-tRNA deacylase [Phycisphaerales bacterium]
MRVVVQRVSEARVVVDGEAIASIGAGLVLFVGLETDDRPADMTWVANKVRGLRVFEDAEGKMNLDAEQARASILAVPNFTVAGSVERGRRPSFDTAMEPVRASEHFDLFVRLLRQGDVPVETGRFGAEMHVSLTSDGPITLIVERRPGVGQA